MIVVILDWLVQQYKISFHNGNITQLKDIIEMVTDIIEMVTDIIEIVTIKKGVAQIMDSKMKCIIGDFAFT